MNDQSRRKVSASLVLMIACVVCFVLAAVSVKLADINLFYLGFAFWAAARIF